MKNVVEFRLIASSVYLILGLPKHLNPNGAVTFVFKVRLDFLHKRVCYCKLALGLRHFNRGKSFGVYNSCCRRKSDTNNHNNSTIKLPIVADVQIIDQ